MGLIVIFRFAYIGSSVLNYGFNIIDKKMKLFHNDFLAFMSVVSKIT